MYSLGATASVAPTATTTLGRSSKRCTLRRVAGAKRNRSVVVNVVAPNMPATSNSNREPSEDVIELIRKADAVAFDVDSTVCTDEGIDELAAFLGKGDEVAEMTNKAMGGGINFRDALEMRLQVMQPTRQTVEKYLANNPPKISPGIKDLFDGLRANGKTVYLVSGGFRQMINPVAVALEVPRENIFANNLLFNEDGSYAGFDPEEFTSKAGGKAEAVKHVKKTFGHEVMAMVGDGATDLESRAPGGADVFVGYGGVQVRKAVEEGADWFVTDFDKFLEVVKGSK